MRRRLAKKKLRKQKRSNSGYTVPEGIVEVFASPAPKDPWLAAAFVATPGDVPLTLVPPWITGLVVQVAWGSGPPPQPISEGWLAEARRNFDVYAWAWCQGADVENEARWHADCAQGYAGFVANMEEPYDAHGNSADPRYKAPERYLEALRGRWSGPLGVTTTWSHGSDMTAWVAAGALTMPQAFSKEVPSATLSNAVQHAQSWGWPLGQIRPLVQSYPTNGQRPDPTALNSEALQLNVGCIPYTIEQAMDEAGQEWLTRMRPSIERPQASSTPPPEPEPAPTPELIGPQHGIDAMFDRLIKLDPGGSKPNRNPNDLATWGAYDKARRSLKKLVEDHDAAISDV